MAGRDWAALEGRETDDNWAARDRMLCDAADELSACPEAVRLAQWAPGLRPRLRDAIDSTHSSRTQMSVSACRFLAALARHTDVLEDVDYFADAALAAALRVCANTKKIVAAGGTELLAALLMRAPYARVQAMLLSSVLPDRNAALRARAMDVVAAVVAQRGPPRTWAELEGAFVRAIADATPAVRQAAVRVLECCYAAHAGDIRAMVAARLDPLAAKVLRQVLLRSAVCADLVQPSASEQRPAKPWSSPQREANRPSDAVEEAAMTIAPLAASAESTTSPAPNAEETIVEPTRRLSFAPVHMEMHDEDVPRYVASDEDLRVPMTAILGEAKLAPLQIATPMRAAMRHRLPVASPMRPLSVEGLVAQLAAPPVAIATWKKLCLLAESALQNQERIASAGTASTADSIEDTESPFVASHRFADAVRFPCADVLRATADAVCAGVVPDEDLGTVGVLVRTTLRVGGAPADMAGVTQLLLRLSRLFDTFADLWTCEPPLLWLPAAESRLLWLASCAERRTLYSSEDRVLLLNALCAGLKDAPAAWLPPVVRALMAVWSGSLLDVDAKRALMPCLAAARAVLGPHEFARALPQPLSPSQQRLLDAYCEFNRL